MKDFPVLEVVPYRVFHNRRVAPVDLSGVLVNFLDHPRDVIVWVDDVIVYQKRIISKTPENLPTVT